MSETREFDWFGRVAVLIAGAALALLLRVGPAGPGPLGPVPSGARTASGVERPVGLQTRLRLQRAQAIRQARAAGKTQYSFEFEGPLPLPVGPGR